MLHAGPLSEWPPLNGRHNGSNVGSVAVAPTTGKEALGGFTSKLRLRVVHRML